MVEITKNYQRHPVVLWSFRTLQHHGLNSYQEAYQYISQQPSTQCLCEDIKSFDKLNPYFDIEWKQDQYDVDISFLKNKLLEKFTYFFGDLTIDLFVKQASGDYTKRETKKTPLQQYYRMSYHVILHLKTLDNLPIYLRGKDQMKSLYYFLNLHPAFDDDVYKGTKLRLLNQDKYDSSRKAYHHRILVKNEEHSTTQNPFDQYIGYCPEHDFIYIDEYVQQRFVLQSVKDLGYSKNYTLDSFKYDGNKPADQVLQLTEQKCPKREHQSNNSLALLFIDNSPHLTIKCMDEECDGSLTQWLDLSDFEITVKNQTHGRQNDSQDTQDSQDLSQENSQEELQLTSNSIQNDVGQVSAHKVDSITKMGPNGFEAMGQVKQALQDILGTEVCQFTGKDGKILFSIKDKTHEIEYSAELKSRLENLLFDYEEGKLQSMSVVTNNIVNIGAINLTQNINIGNQQEEENLVGSDDINFPQITDEAQLKYVKLLTKSRMHYITHLYNVLKPNDLVYMSNEKPCQNIYYFTNIVNNKQTNGGLWTNEDGTRELRKRIRQEMESYFDNIIARSEDKNHKKLFERLSRMISNTIDKQGNMEQYAMEAFKDTSIKFNQNKHLLHFTNGTYDLDEQEFIQTTKEMYNTQMIKYEFNPKQEYDFIEPVVQQIVGQDEYSWFIKQLSNCLHPDSVIEQKQIVILTGQGNNGKTLVFNLMNNTMDTTAYGVNGRSIMLQASNEQMSAATPDLVLLKDKRFCNFAELDSRKPFNQQQVKQLTGGDMIQARDLYERLQEFKPYAGLFVSCNKMPSIDTLDGGFLNRIKIVELKYQFEDEPQHKFQIKKDKQLLGKIETKKWRQGFMNLLIDNFYKDEVSVPQSVQYSIQSRVNLNQDPIEAWAKQYLDYQEGEYLIPEAGKDEYNEKTNSKVSKNYFQKQINQYIQKNPQTYQNVKFDQKRVSKEDALTYGKKPYAFYNVKMVLDQDT